MKEKVLPANCKLRRVQHLKLSLQRNRKKILTVFLPGYIVRTSNKWRPATELAPMRKINTRDFHVATRGTSREINRRIALNLIREHQPISRADLARRMGVTRGVSGVLVQELIAQGLIFEGATGEAARGRKPTFLHIRTHDRLVLAADVRFSKTYLQLCDFSGRQLSLETFDTPFDIPKLVQELAARAGKMLKTQGAEERCEGFGVVVPGMIDHRTGRILNAPALGWRDVDMRDRLAAATGLPVQLENAGRACALSRLWLGHGEVSGPQNFVYITVSDGVGGGVVSNGELVRGRDHIAGEFGHMSLSLDGPRCLCGSSGCWEAYISNLATLGRYFGWNLSKLSPKSLHDAAQNAFTVPDLVTRARAGDAKALSAIELTARYTGLGLAAIINAVNPDCIYLAGEITAAWDLIEKPLREALAERVLIKAALGTPLRISALPEHPRLRGAAALIAAPTFAAPRVA